VARYLRALIVDGNLRPGERVPRDEIAARLGVSPVPVREAIIALDREGWLRIEPHRGAFVHGVDEAWITDRYGLMGAVYALVASRACRNATDAEIAELSQLGRRLANAHDGAGFTEANNLAMRLLITACRSPRLEAAAREVPNVVPGNFFVEVPDTLEPQRRAMTRPFARSQPAMPMPQPPLCAVSPTRRAPPSSPCSAPAASSSPPRPEPRHPESACGTGTRRQIPA
jgi:DNA-binding GntR family transcriptional regulator